MALDVKVLSADNEEIIVRDSTDDEADYNETMLAEQERRKAEIHDLANDEDDIFAGEHNGEQRGFTDDDDDFSLDGLFDDEHDSDSLDGLFGGEDKDDDNAPEDEENLDLGGLDSLLDAINGDEEDDDNDNDDLFDDDDEDEDEDKND